MTSSAPRDDIINHMHYEPDTAADWQSQQRSAFWNVNNSAPPYCEVTSDKTYRTQENGTWKRWHWSEIWIRMRCLQENVVETPHDLPPLTFPDIFVYLVCGVSPYTWGLVLSFLNLWKLTFNLQMAGSMTWKPTNHRVVKHRRSYKGVYHLTYLPVKHTSLHNI